jgi:FecR protein
LYRIDDKESMPGRVINFSAIVMLICLALSVASAALAQDVVGSIINGTAQVVRDGHALNLMSGMAVKAHDELRTTPDENLTIGLSNGDLIRLTGSSSIVIRPFANQRPGDFMIELKHGQVRCTVGNGSLAVVPGLEVRAPNAITIAHGTDFEVAYITGRTCPDSLRPCREYTDISVYKGMLEVSNPADPKTPPVQISQGYGTAVPCDLPPTSPAPLAMNELAAPGYQ